MTHLQHPFSLGQLELPSNVIYSPLAGCSDYPFRRMASRYRPGLIYCEMVKMDALVRNDPGTFHLLDYDEGMHPIGAQLVGSKPELAGTAARIIEDLGFDVVDLNCGCPVDKVTKDGSGSGMLCNPQRIGDVLSAMVAAVSIPVTVKIRIGWDEASINGPDIVRIAEDAGASAIAVHGRTRKQAYRGPADWSQIRACKAAANRIKVIGNGDIFSAEDALRMFEETGCDAVLCSRGTLGQPWIADDIYRLAAGHPAIERGAEERMDALREHYHEMIRYHNERRCIIDMRRVGCWYIKKGGGAKEFRSAMSRAQSLADVDALLHGLAMAG